MADTADMRKELNTLKQDLAALRGDFTSLSESSGRTAREGAEAIYNAAKDATAQAREKLMKEADELMHKVRSGAKDVAGTVKDSGQAALNEVEHTVQERPLTSVLAAVGVGFVVGMLLSRR